jgi:hypothetical protein
VIWESRAREKSAKVALGRVPINVPSNAQTQRRVYGPFTSLVQKMTLATTWPWATAYAVELN